MLRSLCLGSGGSLGREVAKLTTYSADHTDFDLSCRPSVKRILEKYKPDVVINCAGLVRSRIVPETAMIMVNSLGSWYLRYECEAADAKLLHVSTDCVFAGQLKFPATYTESHIPNPVDTYGKSKLAGEAGHVTVRSSFVGHGKYGLLHWLTTTKASNVEGYVNAMWSGLTSPALAIVLYEIAQYLGGAKKPIRPLTPLLHVHGECVSKYALLGMLNNRFKLGKEIVPVAVPVINRCLSSNYSSFVEVPMLPDMIAGMPNA